MISIQIPKDIREYEPKFVGPLTFRQAVCLVAAAAIEIGGTFFQTKVLGLPSASFIPPLPLAAVPLLFGWGKQIFRMDTEVFIKKVLLRNFTCPSYRIYKTMNYYDVYLTDGKKTDHAEKRKQKRTKNDPVPEELRVYN